MSASSFLVIDEQPVTLEQAVNYLQAAGKFQPFLLDILYQHAINQALGSHPGLQLVPELLEQALIDFRVEQELVDPQVFQAWLDGNGLSYETFRQQYQWYLTCERLKIWLSQSVELHEELTAELRDEIFAQWLTEQVSAMNVKLEVN